VSGRLLPGFVEITITDTGIGIDPEFHSRIFEKFGRLGNVSLHSTGKTKFKGGGPGLGLSIAKGVIEAHGGTIWVESDGYDEIRCPGSTFHILLPLRTSPPDARATKLFHPLSNTAD
jgi:signal transduction histidine kinase